MSNLSRRAFIQFAAAAAAVTAVPIGIAPAVASTAPLAAASDANFAAEWWGLFDRLPDADKLRYSQILRDLDPRFSELCDMIDRLYAPAKRKGTAKGVRGKQA